jgi:hypothetical protein
MGNWRRPKRRSARERDQSREELFVRQLAAAGTVELSVRDLPTVNRALRCAMPVLLWDERHPEYPGAKGTAFAFRYKGVVALMSAEHVVRDAPERGICIPTFTTSALTFETGEGLLKAAGVAWLPVMDQDDTDQFDLALLPLKEKSPRGVYPLELSRIANLRTATAETLFAMAGYARSDQMLQFDYEGGALNWNPSFHLGTYAGAAPDRKHCHLINLNTEWIGGPDGLSGSPVLRVDFARGRVRCALAGVAVRANLKQLLFVDVRRVVGLVLMTEKELGWPIPLPA